MFLQPDVIPPMAKKGRIIDPVTGDTIIIHLSGNNFQPTFTYNNGAAIKLDCTIESVIFQNKDGANLNGWLLKPAGTVAPALTLFFLHGNGGNITTEYPLVMPFVKQGFQVFIFDYSGYGFSQGKAARGSLLSDSQAALNYCLSRPDIKNTRIIIYGQSLGGHLAATVAERNEALIHGLVIEGAFSSYKDIAAFKSKMGIIARMLVKGNHSATRSIKQYHKPLLVIHSTEDPTIPFKMGRKIFDHANEPKSFYEIKGCHACGPILYPDSIIARIKSMQN